MNYNAKSNDLEQETLDGINQQCQYDHNLWCNVWKAIVDKTKKMLLMKAIVDKTKKKTKLRKCY